MGIIYGTPIVIVYYEDSDNKSDKNELLNMDSNESVSTNE